MKKQCLDQKILSNFVMKDSWMVEDDLVLGRKKVGCFKTCHIVAKKVMMGRMEEKSYSLLVIQD